MSSAIKLYEHNQKAYDALLDMLGECDRACVIKPTGTDTSGRAGRTGRLPTRSRHLPCSDGSNNGS